jgi:hypothetical protein
MMEQYYGTSLDWFFHQWIYGMGYPSYAYSWSYEQAGDHYVVDLTIEQVQDISGSEEVFTMPLDVMISGLSGLVQDTLPVWNNEQIQTFQLITDIEPAIIELDPENWVLNESNEVSSIKDQDESLPKTYNLQQNYPNPFNPVTTINYQLPITDNVELSIFNLQGQKIETLVSEQQSAGDHAYQFDGRNLASGVYYYQLISGSFRDVKKMILLR